MSELPANEIRTGQILLVTRAGQMKGLLDCLCVVRARDHEHIVLEFIAGGFSRGRNIYRLDEFGFVKPERDFVLAAIGEEALLEIEAKYRPE